MLHLNGDISYDRPELLAAFGELSELSEKVFDAVYCNERFIPTERDRDVVSGAAQIIAEIIADCVDGQ